MHGGLYLTQSPVLAKTPSDFGDGVTKSDGVDLMGFDGCVWNIVAGALGSTGTLDCKIQESVDDVDGHYTDVLDVDGNALALVQVPDTGDNHIYALDGFRGTKRWQRAYVTIGGTGVAVVVGVIALRYRVQGTVPVTLDATLGQYIYKRLN